MMQNKMASTSQKSVGQVPGAEGGNNADKETIEDGQSSKKSRIYGKTGTYYKKKTRVSLLRKKRTAAVSLRKSRK